MRPPLCAYAASDTAHSLCLPGWADAKHCEAVPLGEALQPDSVRPLAASLDPVQPPSGKLRTRCPVCCGAGTRPCRPSRALAAPAMCKQTPETSNSARQLCNGNIASQRQDMVYYGVYLRNREIFPAYKVVDQNPFQSGGPKSLPYRDRPQPCVLYADQSPLK